MDRQLTLRIAGAVKFAGALTVTATTETKTQDMAQAPGHVPSGFGEAVDRDVARVRAATAPFTSTDAATAAGYKKVTECVEHQPDGAMGYHFQNNALLDTTLDVEHPEVPVYERKSDGAFKLNGVEFLVPISKWTTTRAAAHHGAAAEARGRPGHLVLACVDVGAQPERALRRLESSREVRVWQCGQTSLAAESSVRHQQFRRSTTLVVEDDDPLPLTVLSVTTRYLPEQTAPRRHRRDFRQRALR